MAREDRGPGALRQWQGTASPQIPGVIGLRVAIKRRSCAIEEVAMFWLFWKYRY
jgi:hypothetical protein